MFSRSLRPEERRWLEEIELFVKEKHANLGSHDYSHVIQVTEFAIEIANNIEQEVDPVVVICGALLHDIGRTISNEMHGLVGSSMAEMLLESLPLNDEQIERITKVIVRHTATSHVAPQSVEEKIVYDARRIGPVGGDGAAAWFCGQGGKHGGCIGKLHSQAGQDL